MWIFGLILLMGSLFPFYGYFRHRRKIAFFNANEPASVDMLKQLSESMESGVGQGWLSYNTEINGIVQCDKPLISEIAQKPCIFYETTVTREFEESYSERDQKGREVRPTRTVREVVSSNRREVLFRLVDSTGEITINPAGAEFIPQQVASHYEPERENRQEFRFENFVFQLPGSGIQDNRRTLGYRFQETVIEVGGQVYINGVLSDQSGTLLIQKPSDGRKLLISTKDETQLLRESRKKMNIYLIIGSLLSVLGLGLLIFGLRSM